ncbi:MAG: septum formation initiator family protein [Eubacteriales bacterium]|nr:septum formation initiator family protein [Eubacteriales bacterium]
MQKRKGRLREFEKNNRAVDFDEAREQRQSKRENTRKKKNKRIKATVTYEDTPSKRKRWTINKVRIGITVIMIILIAVVAVSIKGIFDLKIEQKQLMEQNKQLKSEKENLQAELENIDSYDYIEEQARIQLKLIKPGEILYILNDEKQEDENKGI